MASLHRESTNSLIDFTDSESESERLMQALKPKVAALHRLEGWQNTLYVLDICIGEREQNL